MRKIVILAALLVSACNAQQRQQVTEPVVRDEPAEAPDPFLSKRPTEELIADVNEAKAECPKPEEDVDCTYLIGLQDELKRRGVKF